MFRTAVLTLVLSAAWAVPGVAQTTITSLSPASAIVGGPAFTLHVFGTNFGPLMPIQWDGATQTTTFVSSTHLTCTISAAMIATTGPHNVRVRITALPLLVTTTLVFNVNNPAPVVTSMSPTSIGAGASGVLLIIGGSGFNSSTTVTADGTPLSVSSATGTNLNASVPGSLLAFGDTLTISVSNPAPGGGTAAPQTLTVNNPVPTMNFVSPFSVAAGSGAASITVVGTGFCAASVVRLDGADLPTTFGGVSILTATVPAGTTAAAGAHTVTVHTPAPGGGTTSGSTFNVNNPVPTLASISPTTVFVGSPDTTVTFVGTNFNAQSVARRNGINLATTLVSPTQLTAVVPAANLATFNTATLLVVNPAPGGGGTAGFSFSAINHAAPTVSSLAPSSIFVQSTPVTVTVTGTGFDPFTVVRFNGADCPTTFVSATTVTAVFSGTQVSTAGVASITAFNPTPGGGTSAALTFSVTMPAPVVTSFTPTAIPAGSGTTPVIFTGSGFGTFTSAFIDDVPPLPLSHNLGPGGTFVVAVPSARLAQAGFATIKLQNPSPGGGISSGSTISITSPAPGVATIFPEYAVAGSPDTLVLLNGLGFSPLSTVEIVGFGPLTTSFLSATQLHATVPAAALTAVAPLTLQVVTPPPGGGTSNPIVFHSFNDPAPTMVSLAGTLPLPVAPNGRTFVFNTTGCHSGTTMLFDGAPVPAGFTGSVVGAQTMFVTINSGVVTVGGTHTFQLVNGGVGGGTGPVFTVDWLNPLPTVSSLTPSTMTGGSPATVVNVFGSGFNASSVVHVDDAPVPTNFVNAGHLTTTLSPTFFAVSGFRRFRVVNPPPGGGASFTVSASVSGPKIATATPSVLPVATPGGPPTTLTLTGSFPSSTGVARVNGVVVPSVWVSSSLLLCTLDATLPALQQPGGFALTVVQQLGGLGPVASNAFGVTVGVAGSPDNAGTVSVLPRTPLPNEEFLLRVEAPVVGQPLSLIADFAQTALVPLVFDPTFDVVSGVLFGLPFPLADGLGLFGPPTGATFRADDLTVFGVPNPRGVFDLRGLVAPPVPYGLTFNLQAIYLDPARPFGFNVTHVNPQTL
jgi:hypothetical protein